MNNEVTVSDDMSIKNKIYTIRGMQVMLDSDLAEIYEVELRRLNEQVKRNIDRFPENFRFQLTKDEFESLRSQIVTLNESALRSQNATLESQRGKHRKYLLELPKQEEMQKFIEEQLKEKA